MCRVVDKVLRGGLDSLYFYDKDPHSDLPVSGTVTTCFVFLRGKSSFEGSRVLTGTLRIERSLENL